MKKYLIIGGAGFIGSHLWVELLRQGNSVVLVDSVNTHFTKGEAQKIKSYTVDAEDTKKIATVFKKEKPDVVFHLAGAINLRKPIDDSAFLKDLNFLSRTGIILDACKKYGVKKIVFVSSGGAVYQDATMMPTKETYQIHPTTLYGLANVMIEQYIQMYSKKNNLDFVVVRLSNAYGPGQWVSGFIPAMILKIHKGEAVTINGDGHQTRDFIYIHDAVLALISLAEKSANEIYNVGSGKEISLNELFEKIKKILGSDVVPTYKELAVRETQRSALDIAKIQKDLGWAPITSIEEGLRKTVEFYAK